MRYEALGKVAYWVAVIWLVLVVYTSVVALTRQIILEGPTWHVLLWGIGSLVAVLAVAVVRSGKAKGQKDE